MTQPTPRPNRFQYSTVRSVTEWYIRNYYRTPDDIGVLTMFCREDYVGHFASDPEAIIAGDGATLFRLLVTMIMFQRQSDQQIMRVLRGISKEDAHEMTNAEALLKLSDSLQCPNARRLSTLKECCDLSKDPKSKLGVCNANPMISCHMKRHTELLKRYGHFGKVPTSAALTLRENGVSSLQELKNHIWEYNKNPSVRAEALEQAISRSWRVSKKIAAMFLSSVSNSDLSGNLAPWSDGVDTYRFVVIDSNVDLFLKSIGYNGPMSYDSRCEFIQALSKRVHLDKYHHELKRYNPRIVQQAIFMFMSKSNRRAIKRDCSNLEQKACQHCSSKLITICPRKKLSSV